MAPKKRLVKYLEKYLGEYEEEQLRSRLIKDGWKEENINSAIEIVKKKRETSGKKKKDKKSKKKAKKAEPKVSKKEKKEKKKSKGFLGLEGKKESKDKKESKEKPKKKEKNKPKKKEKKEEKKIKAHETREWKGIKHKSSALMVILSLITGGLFFIIWLAITTNELRRNSKTAPSPYWLFILLLPIASAILIFTMLGGVQDLSQLGSMMWLGILSGGLTIITGIIMLIYYWKYSAAINEISDFSSVGLFLLFVFTITAPVAQVISQMKLNNKAEKKPKKKKSNKKAEKEKKSEKKKTEKK